jgi:transcription antitermination factor NusG
MSNEKAWYIAYVGDPKKINTIQIIFETLKIDFSLWCPSQTVYKTKRGEVTTGLRMLFPGYVFIHVNYDGFLDEQLYEGKIGYFLKAPGAYLPTMLTEDEIKTIRELENIRPEPSTLSIPCNVHVGDFVEITNGPFLGAKGAVIDVRRDKVRVELVVFGRLVAVDVEARSVFVKSTEGTSNSKP